MPIIKNAVRVESNKKASLFSAIHLSGDDSRIPGTSVDGNIEGKNESDASSILAVSNFGIFFESNQDKWVKEVLGFFFWAIFNRQNRETAFFTDSKSISNTLANYKKQIVLNKAVKIYWLNWS